MWFDMQTRLMLKQLLAFFSVFFVYFTIATGKSVPVDEDAYGVVSGLIVFFIFIVVSLSAPFRFVVPRTLFSALLLFFGILIVSSFRSSNLMYGFLKIEGAVVTGLIASYFLFFAICLVGKDEAAKFFIFVALIIFVMTMLYRGYYGYSGREGRFFLNGPIVFGWLMGVGALFGFILYLKGCTRYLLVVPIFVFGIILSQSKGPLVAVLSVLLVCVFTRFRAAILMVVCLSLISILLYYSESMISEEYIGRYSALIRILTGSTTEVDAGSVDIRMYIFWGSVDLWLNNFLFGVGLGNWGNYIDPILKYPHNIYIEILSELGFLGFVSFLGLLLYLFFLSEYSGRLVLVYFSICLAFSGDLTYMRLVLFYPLALIAYDRSVLYSAKGN